MLDGFGLGLEVRASRSGGIGRVHGATSVDRSNGAAVGIDIRRSPVVAGVVDDRLAIKRRRATGILRRAGVPVIAGKLIKEHIAELEAVVDGTMEVRARRSRGILNGGLVLDRAEREAVVLGGEQHAVLLRLARLVADWSAEDIHAGRINLHVARIVVAQADVKWDIIIPAHRHGLVDVEDHTTGGRMALVEVHFLAARIPVRQREVSIIELQVVILARISQSVD